VGGASHTEGWPRVIDWISARSSLEEIEIIVPESEGQIIDEVQSSKISKTGSRPKKKSRSAKGTNLESDKIDNEE